MTYEIGTGNSEQEVPSKEVRYEFPKAFSVTSGLIHRRGFVPGTDSKAVARTEMYILPCDSTDYRALVIEDFSEARFVEGEGVEGLWSKITSELNGSMDSPIILWLDPYLLGTAKDGFRDLVTEHNQRV